MNVWIPIAIVGTVLGAVVSRAASTSKPKSKKVKPAADFLGIDNAVTQMFERSRPYVTLLYCSSNPKHKTVLQQFRKLGNTSQMRGRVLFFEADLMNAATSRFIPETPEELGNACDTVAAFMIAGRLGPEDYPTTMPIVEDFTIAEPRQGMFGDIVTWASGVGDRDDQYQWKKADIDDWMARVNPSPESGE